MPRRRRRSAPRLLLALSLLIATGAAFFLSSCPCAQGNAEQSPAKRAEPLPTTSTPTASSLSSSSIFVADDPDDDNPDLPTVSASGYVPNGGPDRGGGQLFFAYYEKKNKNGTSANENDPIFLWLEGGPGCASTFGALYINGPDRVLASRDAEGGKRRTTGKLRNNSHAWNAVGGMLYVDQPVGTGLSVPGEGGEGGSIPRTEVEVAADLYFGLCELFGAGGPLQALASRPFFITGESYAGKFVPSIAHYILQAEQEAGTKRGGRTRTPAAGVASSLRLQVRRELRRESGGLPPRPPPFHLAGIAVGNGLVDPGSQVLTHASSLYYRGLIDAAERARTMAAALQVSALVRVSAFSAAHAARARLLARLSAASGVGTLLDTRRYEDYDAGNAVDQYLNIPEVRRALGVNESLYLRKKVDDGGEGRTTSNSSFSYSSTPYAACSEAVAAAMDADVMRSTARLFPDILDAGVRVLVYVGADDVQDGAAATDAWLSRLKWRRSKEFRRAARKLWELEEAVVDDEKFGSGCTDAEGGSDVFFQNGVAAAFATGSLVETRSSSSNAPVVGYWRSGGGLDHVTVRNGGHMLPHDQPIVSLAMLGRWSRDALSASPSSASSSADYSSPSSAAAAAAAVA